MIGGHDKLISYINKKSWWHVPPVDPKAYKKRGIFYSPTFRAAEFYGRPIDVPQRVTIVNPLVGDERKVQTELFGKFVGPPDDEDDVLGWRFAMDFKMRAAALKKGYDAIVILSSVGFERYRTESKIPRGIELNILTYVPCA